MSTEVPAANSPWWLSGTPLEAEHRKLMHRRHAPIPWEQCKPDELDEAERARVTRTWMKRAEAEHLAVSTFAILSIDLTAAGAPADVLSLCHRAAIDEVRHAELCIRMVEIYSGERQLPPSGMSNLPDAPERPKLEQAVANTLLVSCVAETYATTALNANIQQTTDPCALEVLRTIYSDEIMHARLGWSYLRYGLERDRDATIAAANEMIPVAIRGVARVVETPRPTHAISDALRGHGIMTPQEDRELFSQTIRDVLAPGFEALGLDVGDIVEEYDEAWAAQPPPTPDDQPVANVVVDVPLS